VNGFFIQLRTGCGEVYEIAVVGDDRIDARSCPEREEAFYFGPAEPFFFPLTCTFREDLDRPAAQLFAPNKGVFDAAGDGNVGAQ